MCGPTAPKPPSSAIIHSPLPNSPASDSHTQKKNRRKVSCHSGSRSGGSSSAAAAGRSAM